MVSFKAEEFFELDMVITKSDGIVRIHADTVRFGEQTLGGEMTSMELRFYKNADGVALTVEEELHDQVLLDRRDKLKEALAEVDEQIRQRVISGRLKAVPDA